MADKLTQKQRTRLMSQVRGKDTKPERQIRGLLHRLGYRFTINGPRNKQLPGRPDIVLPKHQTAILVHGCFWHRHPNCKSATTPSSNVAYWEKKFARNVQRDRQNEEALQALGWHVIVIWECELQEPDAIAALLISQLPRAFNIELPETLEDAQLVAETRSRYGAPKKPEPATSRKRSATKSSKPGRR